jgi:hypothetical protein
VNRPGYPPRLSYGGPGVSRIDLACDRHCRKDTAALIRRWGRDRALTPAVVEDMCLLASTALAHAVRLGPSSVCVRLRWADPDRVRVDVEWQGVEHAVARTAHEGVTRATAEVMDAIAVAWGLKVGSPPGHWMIVDTRTLAPRSAASSR